MKSDRRTFDRLLDKPDPATRFYLFHGYDAGQSRAHAERLLAGLGAEKVTIAGGAARSDPAVLADEAGAIDMFGARRAIWVEPAGEEIADAVDALLDASAIESPVIAVAGGLRKTSRLLKLAEASRKALAHVSYELSERDTERLVEELARTEGLRLGSNIAQRIAASCGAERGLIAQELTKIALFAGAAPERPKDVDSTMLDAIGIGSEGEWSGIGDVALTGNAVSVAEQLARAGASAEPIVIIRAIQRRLLMLARLQAQVDGGKRVDDAMASMGKSLFFKDKALVGQMLRQWNSPRLARIATRVGELERSLMRGDAPPPVDALGEELIAVARSAQRGRSA